MTFVVPAPSETPTACCHCNAARVFELALPLADCERAAQPALVLCCDFAGHLRSRAELPAIWFAARTRSEPGADFDLMAVAENYFEADWECHAGNPAQCPDGGTQPERHRNSDD